jgi:hypothetical protein
MDFIALHVFQKQQQCQLLLQAKLSFPAAGRNFPAINFLDTPAGVKIKGRCPNDYRSDSGPTIS